MADFDNISADFGGDFSMSAGDFSGFDMIGAGAENDLNARNTNPYDVQDVDEKDRLAFQRNLTREEDVAILHRLLDDLNRPIAVMEFGCNNAEYLCDRLENLGLPLENVYGVDIDEAIIREAQEKFPECNFIQANIEDDDFVSNMLNYMKTKPDVIILSMILLHIQNPCIILEKAHQLLAEGGKVFIRDMDDGLSVAFPDEGIYDRVLDISNRSKYTGNRHNGREILYSLKKTGFKNIKCEKVIVDTTGLTREERRLLCFVNFGYIRGDVALAAKDDPENFEVDNQWYNQVAFPTLLSLFDREDFYYRMGIILFTAEI